MRIDNLVSSCAGVDGEDLCKEVTCCRSALRSFWTERDSCDPSVFARLVRQKFMAECDRLVDKEENEEEEPLCYSLGQLGGESKKMMKYDVGRLLLDKQ